MYLKKWIDKGKSHYSFFKQYKNLMNLLEMLLHWVVLTSLLTVPLSHLVITYFFLTFDNSIVTLGSTDITYDRTFIFGPTTKDTFLLTNNRLLQ